MNILRIARKEIIQSLRETRTFIFMLAFPIVLMLILGTALSNTFTTSLVFEDLKLAYKIENADAPVSGYWTEFARSLEQNGVALSLLSANEDGKEKVKDGEYAAYAEIKPDGVEFFGSTKQTVESDILQGLVASFANRYSLAAAASRTEPESLAPLLAKAGSGDYVNETSLQADRAPGSMDYYAMAMSTMIAFYACMSASMLIRGERLRNTALRLSAAPISKGELFAGKVVGSTVVNFIFVVAVVAFSKWVFGADWGDHYGAILIVLFTEVLLAVSVGIGASYLFKGEGASAAVMTFTQIASFVGGAYFPIGDIKGAIGALANLSPLRWANEALTKIIYSNDVQALWPAVLLNVLFAIVFLTLSILFMRRKEAL
ncbi:ABC transporter permease [Cohnella sp. AR92]|uniref:ABC transporter permease n=1 Tax=Cohnella sp. AR92 TaxID=648716 RepID=UPI000F8E97FA|nr:ABC transporter permease [Cohnella sp. AR92]RUS45348.1 ABC transporter permease [Cohnella sp. AR92]